MRIVVNGQWREQADSATLSELLAALSLEPRRVAVELNQRLVTRGLFDQTRLKDQDQLEIVTLVGGG